MGVPDHFTCLLRNLYAVREATFRIEHGTMNRLKIGKGVHQGYILAPVITYMNSIRSMISEDDLALGQGSGLITQELLCSRVFSSVQSLSCVRLFVTPWTAACQARLSITNSQSLLKLMSIGSVMPSNHLILGRPLLLPPSIFPGIWVFMSQFFISGGQSTGVSASASVLTMIIQD